MRATAMAERSMRRAMWTGFGLIMAACLGLAALELYNANWKVDEIKRSRALVVQTFEIISSIDAVFEEAQEAQRAARLFASTRDPAEAARYRERMQRLQAFLAKAKALTADNPEQQRRWPGIEQQVAAWSANLERGMAATQGADFDALVAYLRSNAPLDAMRSIGGLTDAAIVAERALLTDRLEAAAAAERASRSLSLAAAALALAIMTLGAILLLHAIRTIARSDRALDESRSALVQAQKMDALGKLTGGVAHDFNNLLQVIIGSIEVVERHLKAGQGDVERWIRTAKRGAERGAGLTQRLLAFARRQPLQPTPIEVNRLVTGIVDLLRRTLPEEVAIETVLGAGTGWTSVDANQLENAILNLAVNSGQAMPQGGKLTIETSNAFLDDTYAAAEAVRAGHYVMIAVSDTGSGMTKDVTERAFEPFFTTKEEGHGTGLGLSQVYGFVRQSNGHVTIYSEPAQGTTVKIYLPRMKAAPSAQPAEEAAPPASQPGSATVLVVEDDDDVRAFTTQALRELGYRVLAAADGPAALDMLQKEPRVDLLFTDVGLPRGMDGRQLSDEAQRRRAGIRVLFTTAYARSAIVHNGRLDADVELITKPYTHVDLERALRRALAR